MKKLALLLSVLALVSLTLLTACERATKYDDTSAASTAASTNAATDATTEAPTEASTQAPSTKVTYTVTVVDQNGDAVVGVEVQMCDDKGCKLPAPTDAQGVVTFNYDPSNYHITIVNAPAGYEFDVNTTYDFPEDSNELTVILNKN